MKSLIAIAIAALVALTAGITAYWWWPDQPQQRVPSFTLPNLSGENRSATDWRGDILVLNFWATWCKPCREEIPMLVRAQNDLGGRGVQIVGMAVDNPEPVRKFAQEYGINYPVLVETADTMRVQNALGGSAGLPFTVVVDRRGRVHAKQAGRIDRARLEAMLAPLLAAE